MGYLETMKRLALSLALMIGLAAPAMADRVPLSQLSRYLNGIGTAEGDFTQINADGSISTGSIYIHRPAPDCCSRIRCGAGSCWSSRLRRAVLADLRRPVPTAAPMQYPLRETPS